MASGDLEKRYKSSWRLAFPGGDRLNFKYGGIKNLMGKPGAVKRVKWLTLTDANVTVRRARGSGYTSAVVIANVNPTSINYILPGNDDAIKSIQLLLKLLC